MNYYKNFDISSARKLIKAALAEDVRSGDVTSEALIPKDNRSKAVLRIKDTGIIAGLEIFKEVFRIVDKNVKIKLLLKEGSRVKKGDIAAELEGSTRNLLKGERVGLNILQRMSGIATQTDRLNKKLGNSSIKIIDTRKTTPNLRILEKVAVRIGGGANHRFSLYDMMLIKDNHIEANGGIINTLERLKKIKRKKELKIELEVKNLSELKKVLDSPPGTVDRIMLDNFSIPDTKKAAQLVSKRFEVEISGGVNESNIGRYKNIKGIDYISSGSITHSVRSMDISLDFIT